jgi:hypothetical protein
MATRTTTQLRGTHDEAGKSVRASGAAGGPHADLPVIGSGRDGASGGAGGDTAGKGRGAGIGATLGTLLGSGAGLMAGIGALPVPGAGPVVAAGWLVAVLTGAGIGAGVGAAVVAAVGGLLRSLAGAGGDEGDAHVHAEDAKAARRRGTALPARVEEAEPARLGAVLAGGGGHVDAAPRGVEHRAEGWNRPGPAAPHHTASGVPAERERRVRVHGAPAAAAGTEVTGDAALRAGGAAAETARRVRVYSARAMADAAVRGSAGAVQQAGPSVGDAPRQGAEVTADAPRQGGEARTEAVRRVRVYDARAAVDAAPRRDAEAVRQGSRPAGDTPRQGTELPADATRRGAEAGARRASEAEAEAEPARREAQAVVESHRRIARDVAEPVGEAGREAAEAARDTTEEARRPAAPDAAGGGPRGLQQGVAGLFEGVVRTNLRVAQELMRLSDPVPMIELQQRFAREYTDTLVLNGATLVGAMRRTADETLRPLERRIERRGRADEDGPRFQRAAE